MDLIKLFKIFITSHIFNHHPSTFIPVLTPCSPEKNSNLAYVISGYVVCVGLERLWVVQLFFFCYVVCIISCLPFSLLLLLLIFGLEWCFSKLSLRSSHLLAAILFASIFAYNLKQSLRYACQSVHYLFQCGFYLCFAFFFNRWLFHFCF